VKAGQTVDGGSFTYTSLKEFTELLQTVTVTVSDASLLSSLTLNATVGESSASSTATPPLGTTVFTFSPPISVPPGATVSFSLSGVMAGTAAPAGAGLIRASFNGMNSDGGFFGGGTYTSSVLQPMAGLLRDALVRTSSPGSAWLMLAGAFLPMLLMTWIFQGGVRQRIMAAGFGMIIATMTMTGCDPCPNCGNAKLTSTVQVLVGVTVTDVEGNQLSVIGIPVNLSQLSI
jgi:hypothetical protein